MLSGVNHTMELMHLETFGPVIGLQSVCIEAIVIV